MLIKSSAYETPAHSLARVSGASAALVRWQFTRLTLSQNTASCHLFHFTSAERRARKMLSLRRIKKKNKPCTNCIEFIYRTWAFLERNLAFIYKRISITVSRAIPVKRSVYPKYTSNMCIPKL